MTSLSCETHLTIHDNDPVEGSMLLVGGHSNSKDMLEALAEELANLPTVTNVDTMTALEGYEHPGRLAQAVMGRRVTLHSMAGTDMDRMVTEAYDKAQPVGALDITALASAERGQRKKISVPRFLGGAARLNIHQMRQSLPVIGAKDKADRPAYRRAVTDKAKELYWPPSHIPRYLRPLGSIGTTSTVRLLMRIHASEETPVKDVLIEGDQFGFGLDADLAETARRNGVEVVHLRSDKEKGLELDHETPTVLPKKFVPLAFPEASSS